MYPGLHIRHLAQVTATVETGDTAYVDGNGTTETITKSSWQTPLSACCEPASRHSTNIIIIEAHPKS